MTKIDITHYNIDDLARETIDKLITKFETLNDRTKRHTRDIMELRREIKELGKWKKK